ncbi:hypothetical protein Tco_0198295, partial [Tanacetum coccineum]
MKNEDVRVKNGILIPGGERKRRNHQISKIRKKSLDDICEGKIMAILKSYVPGVENFDHIFIKFRFILKALWFTIEKHFGEEIMGGVMQNLKNVS